MSSTSYIDVDESVYMSDWVLHSDAKYGIIGLEVTMTDANKKALTTYVERELHEAVQEEAQRKRVSVAAVLRWALISRYNLPFQPAPWAPTEPNSE